MEIKELITNPQTKEYRKLKKIKVNSSFVLLTSSVHTLRTTCTAFSKYTAALSLSRIMF